MISSPTTVCAVASCRSCSSSTRAAISFASPSMVIFTFSPTPFLAFLRVLLQKNSDCLFVCQSQHFRDLMYLSDCEANSFSFELSIECAWIHTDTCRHFLIANSSLYHFSTQCIHVSFHKRTSFHILAFVRVRICTLSQHFLIVNPLFRIFASFFAFLPFGSCIFAISVV